MGSLTKLWHTKAVSEKEKMDNSLRYKLESTLSRVRDEYSQSCCAFCGFAVPSWEHRLLRRQTLLVHVEQCSKRPRRDHECRYCGKQFETERALWNHGLVHDLVDDSEDDELEQPYHNNSTTFSDSEDDEDVQNHPTTLSESKHAGDEADIEQEYDLTKLVAGTAIDEPNYKLIGDDEDRHDKEFKMKEPAQDKEERGMSVTWILHI